MGKGGEEEEWGVGGEGKCRRESEEQGRQPGRARGEGGSRRGEEEEGRKGWRGRAICWAQWQSSERTTMKPAGCHNESRVRGLVKS